MTNIEALQTQVDQVAKDLADLKKITDESLKQTQAEVAADKVKTTKAEITQKLEALKGLTDETSKADVIKLEAMLKTLESSDTELIALKSAITPGVNSIIEKNIQANLDKTAPADKTKVALPNTTPETGTENKNWFKRQIDGFSDSTEENHMLKNAGRIAGGIGVGVLVYKGIKALFGRGKDKEEKKDGEKKDGEKTEEPGFWKSTFGKVLKWTGIGTGAYYLTHGLMTGNWLLKDFFNWDKKEKINPKDLNDRYKENVPEAMKPKYEKFGGMVDEFGKANGNTDSLGILENEEKKEIAIPKGAIPASMDNAYANVGEILNTSGDIRAKRANVGGKLWGLVTELGGAIVGKLLKPMIGSIKGLTDKMFGTDGTPNEEFKKRAEAPDLTREEQVAKLMQKYSMVRSYLNDKQKQLKRKYITEKLQETGISNPSEQQITDYERNDDLTQVRLERDFLSKKIVGIDDASSAIVVLESNGVYDTSNSKETQAITDEVKEIRKEIVPDEGIWQKAKNSPDINKDETLRGELTSVSTKFGAHLKEGILHRNIIEGIANGFGILNLDELRNGEADDLEEAIDKLGFGDEVKRFRLDNEDFYTKLQNKTLTKDDITKFEKAINDYFSLLQKVLLEKQAQQENESAGEFGTWFMGRMWSLVSTPTGWVIMGGTVLLARSEIARGVVKRTFNEGAKPIKRIVRPTMRKINIPTILGNENLKLASYGKTKAGYKNFVIDVKKGKMTFKEATHVFTNRKKSRNETGLFYDLFKKQIIGNVGDGTIIKKYFDNNNIRKVLGTTDIPMPKLAEKLRIYETELRKISSVDKKLFCEELFNKANFTNLDDMERLAKNMEHIDITGLESKDFEKMAKSLGKDITNLDTPDKINTFIKNEINAVVNLNELTEAQNLCKLQLKSEVKILNDQLRSAAGPQVTKIEGNIKKLENIVTDIKNFPDDEVKALRKLMDTGIDIKHISRILDASDPLQLLKDIDRATNVVEFEHALISHGMGNFVDDIKGISKLDEVFDSFKLKSLATKLTDVVTLLKQANKITDTVKILAKIPIVG